MSKRKARAGACGVCGRAVVRPTDTQVAESISRACSFKYSTPTTVTVQGHEYDLGQRLLKVRCINHAPMEEF